MAATHGVAVTPKTNRVFTRRCSLILRGVKIFRGALCLAHNDRAMPAQDMNNGLSVAAGGPLAVPGADADGGLHLIAKRPGASITISSVMSGLEIITLPGSADVIVHADLTTTTAQLLVEKITSHAGANEILLPTWSGNGTGLITTAAKTAVPHVRVLGLAKFDIDNSANASTDKAIDSAINEFQCGLHWMVNSSGNPILATDVPGVGYAEDDLTVAKVGGTHPKLPILLAIDELGSGPYVGQVCVDVR